MRLGLPEAEPPPETAATAPGARQVGDYVLGRLLGRGGMGVVYEALHRPLRRPVALKLILDAALASPGALRRFTIEAEAAAKLDHPNIVPIYEVGQADHQPFISMKLVDGETLRTRIARGDYHFGSGETSPAGTSPRVSPRHQQETIARLVATLARAVHHAHRRGVLHRDVTPRNVLFDSAGQPYLTDFGLAKLTKPEPGDRDESGLPGVGQGASAPGRQAQGPTAGRGSGNPSVVGGTIPYMSPEQAAGLQTTEATDIYSLGVILYELLTGRSPFEGSSALEFLRLVQDQDPPTPRSLNPAVDRDLQTICLACLEKAPAARYASAEMVAEELDRWCGHQTIHRRPAGPLLRACRWVQRNPTGAALLGTLCISLAVSLGLLSRAVEMARRNQRLHDLNAADIKSQLRRDWNDTNKSLILINASSLAMIGDLVRRPPPADNRPDLRLSFAVNITTTPDEVAKNYVPFLNRLEEALEKRTNASVRIDLVFCKAMRAEYEVVSNGQVDFQRMGALPYVLAKRRNPGVQLLASEDVGKQAVFAVRARGGISNLKDVRGRSLAFGSASSTVSFVAKMELVRAGFAPSDFPCCTNFETVFQAIGGSQDFNLPKKTHQMALDAVVRTNFDVAVGRLEYFKAQPNGRLKAIFGFPIPPDVYVSSARLSPELQGMLRSALLSIQDQELLAALPLQSLKAMLPATNTAWCAEMESAANTNAWLRSDLDLNEPMSALPAEGR